MAHAVSCFDSDPQSQPDPINEGGGDHKYTKCHTYIINVAETKIYRSFG